MQYHCTVETLRDTLDKYGFAVIPRVIDSTACSELASGLWDFLEHISREWSTPIRRGDASTWKGFYDLCPSHSMLMQHFGIGHSQAAWDVRQHPAIVGVFASLWKCAKTELLASFDGASLGLPPEQTGRGWHRGSHWFHTDQSFRRNEAECVQSWVTAHDVDEGDATLVVLEGSHLLHGEFARRFFPQGDAPGADWFQLKTEEQLAFYRTRCPEVRVACPAGSLVLWDSRTIHQGGNPLKGRKTPRERAVVYLCYQPRTWLTGKARDKAVAKKRAVFEAQRLTKHGPLKSSLFQKLPRHYGRGVPPITPIAKPKLTELGRALAGLE